MVTQNIILLMSFKLVLYRGKINNIFVWLKYFLTKKTVHNCACVWEEVVLAKVRKVYRPAWPWAQQGWDTPQAQWTRRRPSPLGGM